MEGKQLNLGEVGFNKESEEARVKGRGDKPGTKRARARRDNLGICK